MVRLVATGLASPAALQVGGSDAAVAGGIVLAWTLVMLLAMLLLAREMGRGPTEEPESAAGESSAERWTRLDREGREAYAAGRMDEAETRFREALELALGNGPDDRRVAASRVNRASALRPLGRLEEAESELRAAATERRRILGVRHPLVATTLMLLADLLRARGQTAAAEVCVREAVEIREGVVDEGAYELAASLSHLARLRRAREDRREAISLYHRCLELYRSRLGEAHPWVAAVLTNLGVCLNETGEAEASLAMHRRALSSWEACDGPLHPGARACLEALGKAARDEGRSDEAASLAEKIRNLGGAAAPPEPGPSSE